MSIINNAKEIADLVKKLGNIELYKKIVDLEGDIIGLSRENHQQKLKINDLEEQIQIDQEMVFKNPFYYRGDDSQPYCQKCWESDKKPIHLHGPDTIEGVVTYYCYNCENTFLNE